MRILGIESSCDETAAAIWEDGEILSSIVSSQIDVHAEFGGVVPEEASRLHTELITSVIDNAFTDAGVKVGDIDAIAVTNRPGLVGALLVGFTAAKGLALSWNKPLIGIDHIAAHAHANVMTGDVQYPFCCLVASGGHTSIYACNDFDDMELLGATVDDAAGEAFDKVASMLGLGYPGGPVIDKLAKEGDAKAIRFPRARIKNNDLNFSFSGVKTAVRYVIDPPKGDAPELTDELKADIAASFQEAVVDVLTKRLLLAAERFNLKSVAIAGGVACNVRLRDVLRARASGKGISVAVPPPKYCADNAAMIAAIGAEYFKRGESHGLDFDVSSTPVRGGKK